jgi:hypothetical protein
LEKKGRNYGKEPEMIQMDACEGIAYFIAKKMKTIRIRKSNFRIIFHHGGNARANYLICN